MTPVAVQSPAAARATRRRALARARLARIFPGIVPATAARALS
jgi:hypothetical protein